MAVRVRRHFEHVYRRTTVFDLTAQEVAAARHAGFLPISLGPRVLRADTAPLALLGWLALRG